MAHRESIDERLTNEFGLMPSCQAGEEGEWPTTTDEEDCTSQTSAWNDDDHSTPTDREEGEITDSDDDENEPPRHEMRDDSKTPTDTMTQHHDAEQPPSSEKETRAVRQKGKKLVVSIPVKTNLEKQRENLENFKISDTINLLQTPREPIEHPKFEIPNLFCEYCDESTHHHEDTRGILRCKHCRFQFSTIPEYEVYLKIQRKQNLKLQTKQQKPKRKRKPRSRKMKKMAF